MPQSAPHWRHHLERLLDSRNRLFFAATDTEKDLLARSAPRSAPENCRQRSPTNLESRNPHMRVGAVNALGELLTGSDPGLALAAFAALREVAEHDSPKVAAAAH